MSEGEHLAEALEQFFTSTTPGWFTPFVDVLDGLSAEQAATVPAEKFNSVWTVVNHVRFWQDVALRQIQGLPVDYVELGSADESGWPPITDSTDAAWQAARAAVLEANQSLSRHVAGMTSAALDETTSDSPTWNTKRHIVLNMIAHNSYHTCELITIRHMQGWYFGAI